MRATLRSLAGTVCMFLVIGSMSACTTMVAPEEDGTTEYVFEQSSSNEVLSKDDSITSGKDEED